MSRAPQRATPAGRRAPRSGQAGGFLLEALVAILIFSFGILGMVGLQAQSIRHVSDAQYRGEATYLANSYLAKMWSTDKASWPDYMDPAAAGTPAEEFKKMIDAQLPGASAIAGNPKIDLTNGPATVGEITLSTTSSLATVTLWWLLPGEDAALVDPVEKKGHKYIATSVIGFN
jgi:type IV pilus assembly protein PilV